MKVHGEQVHIEGWCARRRYSALAGALGAGLHTHLATSAVLRASLALPPPPLAVDTRTSGTRSSNKLMRVSFLLIIIFAFEIGIFKESIGFFLAFTKRSRLQSKDHQPRQE